MFQSPVRISEEFRVQVARVLQSRLADCLDLYAQVKFIHWNLKGENFISVHKFLDEVAETLLDMADLLAERHVTLLGAVEGSPKFVVTTSKVVQMTPGLSYCHEFLQDFAPHFEQYIDDIRELIELSTESHDHGTANMLADKLELLEKHGWFIRATITGDA